MEDAKGTFMKADGEGIMSRNEISKLKHARKLLSCQITCSNADKMCSKNSLSDFKCFNLLQCNSAKKWFFKPNVRHDNILFPVRQKQLNMRITGVFMLNSWSRPTGPLGWSFSVDIPTSAPKPNSPPSASYSDSHSSFVYYIWSFLVSYHLDISNITSIL